jgi:hypothetical protein
MITNIPTADEFLKVGLRFLGTAWDEALHTAIVADEGPYTSDDGYQLKPEDLLKLASSDLAVALATAQQGVEFIIKSEIARFSPFLLISQDPAKWPKGSDKSDVEFADFRSIDSQDLIRVYNTVCTRRLPGSFVTRFETMRKHRNIIFHTVKSSTPTDVIDIIESILEATNTLIEPFCWPRLRREGLAQAPWRAISDCWKWNPDILRLNEELEYVIRTLPPAKVKN